MNLKDGHTRLFRHYSIRDVLKQTDSAGINVFSHITDLPIPLFFYFSCALTERWSSHLIPYSTDEQQNRRAFYLRDDELSSFYEVDDLEKTQNKTDIILTHCSFLAAVLCILAL